MNIVKYILSFIIGSTYSYRVWDLIHEYFHLCMKEIIFILTFTLCLLMVKWCESFLLILKPLLMTLTLFHMKSMLVSFFKFYHLNMLKTSLSLRANLILL